ncbi:sigma-70 family RNA polymerase sigma factor [Leptospira yasudae]|uniref:Sigma-70 family RNA polymerase sigma factor n=1 Tax=Leptospira yasudae TaxID=2202201 RepID=A0ABX9LYF4_9LEPT|nr:sigma-70 family RNA polymerase sigma factor [Leptospira yasudae]RHX77850.1 hypothetical protein DLM77_19730 [Leptospira yasudae]
MQDTTDLDRIFINSYLTYKNTGNTKALIEQAEFWIRRIAVHKYSLDEDGRSEVLLKFIQKIEYFSELYETRGFKNFPAYAIVFLKHLVLNQWKKEIRFRKREAVTFEAHDLPCRISDEPDYEMKTSIHRIFLNETLRGFDPRGVLIFKLKHNLFLERQEILLLKSVLLASGNSVRDFLKERAEKRFEARRRELAVLERMEIKQQILLSKGNGAADVLLRSKEKLRKKLLKTETIYTHEEISLWFGWSYSVIKRLYRRTLDFLILSGKDLRFVLVPEEEKDAA